MQTKQHIRRLLNEAAVRPKSKLGQNFLIDLNLMRLLIASADIKKNDIVLEVGCGTGSLTEAIAEKAALCIAVEIDPTLAKIAAAQLADKKNVTILNTDILETKHRTARPVINAIDAARKKYSHRLLLVANLPYNVASPVMLNLVTGPTTADAMFVTVQKEVADRMTANPGTKDYGTGTILLAATGELEIIRTLKPTVFWPRPKVDSAMLSYIRKKEKVARIKNMQLLTETVNLFMRHRRKMLKSCTPLPAGQLAQIQNWPELFRQCSIDPAARPDQIPPGKYVELANLCSEYIETPRHERL